MVGNTRYRGRRLLAGIMAIGLLSVITGCSENLGSDPEDLAVGVVTATYERDTSVLSEYPAPSLEQGAAAGQTFEDAALSQLADEGLPEGSIQTEGVQELPVPLMPTSVAFYDVPTTDPEGDDVTATVAITGTENDDDYEYCAVAVRPEGADPYNDDLFDFILGGEDTCGF